MHRAPFTENRPQLPQRLRHSESVALSAFRDALKDAWRNHPHRADVELERLLHDTRVPKCIHELYADWIAPRGQLTHLRVDTVARLSVDVFVAEFLVWKQATSSVASDAG